MTVNELRKHPEYKICMQKIQAFPKGYKLVMDYTKIPTQPKRNAMKVILRDACKNGLLQSVSIGISLSLETTDETFIRI